MIDGMTCGTIKGGRDGEFLRIKCPGRAYGSRVTVVNMNHESLHFAYIEVYGSVGLIAEEQKAYNDKVDLPPLGLLKKKASKFCKSRDLGNKLPINCC